MPGPAARPVPAAHAQPRQPAPLPAPLVAADAPAATAHAAATAFVLWAARAIAAVSAPLADKRRPTEALTTLKSQNRHACRLTTASATTAVSTSKQQRKTAAMPYRRQLTSNVGQDCMVRPYPDTRDRQPCTTAHEYTAVLEPHYGHSCKLGTVVPSSRLYSHRVHLSGPEYRI